MSSDFDMDEILQLFLEESFEGLDIMETGLLNLDIGAPDADTINDIFRAAHSIKGGGGTLGYTEISEFTHGVETLLDEIRAGARTTTTDNVQLLLRSVDHLRNMLTAMSNKEPIDAAASAAVQDEIASLLQQDEAEAGAQPAGSPAGDETQTGVDPKQIAPETASEYLYAISFRPHSTLLARGNDPLRIFRELQTLGEFSATVNVNELPDLQHFEPEHAYLSWELRLKTSVDRKAIEEVFEWVVGECDLNIVVNGEGKPVEDCVTPAPNAAAPSEPATHKAAETKTESAPTQAIAATLGGAEVAVPQKKKQPAARESASIRVSTEKVDILLNLVGELVITQSMLRRFGSEDVEFNLNELRDGLVQLERHTRELQEGVMQIRMLPISFCFSRFPRLVHDLSMKLGKKVDLQLSGEQTELDKTVLEKIGDPLVHLVRNSLDHGVESTEARVAAGKSATGVIRLSASQEGGNIVIQVADDGAGLNRERILEKARERGLVSQDEMLSDERIYNLIFAPGFSTAESVSDVSGRGVGMDVVRRNIKDLGGRVEVHSEPGQGSVFTIRLPLTLAILDGQLVRVGDETFIISLLSIVETVQVKADLINRVPGRCAVYRMRDRYIPVINLSESFGISTASQQLLEGLLVVVEADGVQYGLFVDELLDQQQVVIKSLEDNYRQVEGLAGATILGDGRVALILDVPGLISHIKDHDPESVQAA